MASPRPDSLLLARPCSRWNGSTSRATWSGGITGPVFVTWRSTEPGAAGRAHIEVAAVDVVPDRVLDEVAHESVEQGAVAHRGCVGQPGVDRQRALGEGGPLFVEHVLGDDGEVDRVGGVVEMLAAGQRESVDESFGSV
jgi:hypothetical protein